MKLILQCAMVLVFAGIGVMLMPCDAFSSEEAAYRYATEGVEKIKQGDYEGAIIALKEARRYAPANDIIRDNLAVAYNNLAFSLMNNGDIKRAVEKFENALYYTPGNAYTLYNLGQAYYLLQNIPKARDAVEKAFRVDPDLDGLKAFRSKINAEVGVEKDFERFETMHFIIAAARDVPVEKISYIRTYLEEAYGRIGMFLDYYPQDKTIVLVYSESSYEALLQQKPHWMLAIFDGKVRIPANMFKYTNEEVVKIIYHEYAHAVLYDIVGDKGPMWMHEGVACKAEDFAGKQDPSYYKRVVDAYGLLPIAQLPDDFSQMKDDRLITLAYVESYLLIDFIVSRAGNSGLHALFSDIKRGGPWEVALAKLFKEDGKEFVQKWLEYLRSRYHIDTGQKY